MVNAQTTCSSKHKFELTFIGQKAFTSSSVKQQFSVIDVKKLTRGAASTIPPEMRAYTILQRTKREPFVALKVVQSNPDGAYFTLGHKIKVGRIPVKCKGA